MWRCRNNAAFVSSLSRFCGRSCFVGLREEGPAGSMNEYDAEDVKLVQGVATNLAIMLEDNGGIKRSTLAC